MGSTSNVLANARNVLSGAKAFTKSVEGSDKSRFAPKPVVNQFSGAKYSMAKKASGDADKTGESLKAKSDNVDQYVKNTPKQ